MLDTAKCIVETSAFGEILVSSRTIKTNELITDKDLQRKRIKLNSMSNNYIFDKETKYAEKLHTGSLHNVNAEIGLDIVFPNRYSIFIIYERNQTIKSAHSAQNHNFYIAIGYLTYERAEYAFTINGSENLITNLE